MQMLLFQPDSWGIPSFQATVKVLRPILTHLQSALEFGTIQNRSFFDTLSQHERPRSHLREMIVRDQAKRHLERKEIQVEDEEFIVGDEPLAALVIWYGPVQLRTLKGVDGVIPTCGTSKRRRRFYNQYGESYKDPTGKIRQTKLNLVLLWEFDKLFNLNQTWLTCPSSAGTYASGVMHFWNEPLPLLAAEAPPAPEPSKERIDQELEDLLRNYDQTDVDEESNQA